MEKFEIIKSESNSNYVYFKGYKDIEYVYDYIKELGLTEKETADIIDLLSRLRLKIYSLFEKSGYINKDNEIVSAVQIPELRETGAYYRYKRISKWYRFPAPRNNFEQSNADATEFYNKMKTAAKLYFEKTGLDKVKGMIDPYYIVRLVIYELVTSEEKIEEDNSI